MDGVSLPAEFGTEGGKDAEADVRARVFAGRATTTGIAAANHVLQANGLDPWPIIPPRPPEPHRSLYGKRLGR